MPALANNGSVGPWAKEKLDCLRKYLEAYTKILRKQEWCKGFIFIDGFAGGGKARLRKGAEDDLEKIDTLFSELASFSKDDAERSQYIKGSPNVALELRHRFTHYFFIDLNPDMIGKLREVRDAHADKARIEILSGDANEAIKKEILGGRFDWKVYRAVVFLDPFGMNVPWETINQLAETHAIEVFVNLPVGMAIQRVLPRSGKFTEKQKEKLDCYFGSPDWYSEIYERKADLFGEKIGKRKDSAERLVRWYQSRLRAAFGFSSPARLIRNTKGGHLYYLIWAGPNATGAKIAKFVLSQGEAIN